MAPAPRSTWRSRCRATPDTTHAMRLDYTSDLWWKNAVIYCLDVETYADSDGDGVGDFRGLIEKVDYLAGLGVTCIWLMPFYPSPNRDDGYDISDFYGVDPRLGTLGDFVEFMRTATDRGIRVILDLVVNHTSDEHPWFADSRSAADSPRRHPPPRRAPVVPRLALGDGPPAPRLVRLARRAVREPGEPRVSRQGDVE